jgi:hypothetical protein
MCAEIGVYEGRAEGVEIWMVVSELGLRVKRTRGETLYLPTRCRRQTSAGWVFVWEGPTTPFWRLSKTPAERLAQVPW